ncbi:hypothetical protein EXIGLDRAFT_726661 [Exidia glandulosa HHB12029]|uniref:Uncharacterized protein n=1 Tax=Exidia glandulosa HHB12029 TaxID=1314781 RepID=A0A165DMB6_EXIGL|nr:hypothetical protein EXIGLDRAFT_726661 [Exidia glandulosa HHB12029]
MSSAGSTTVSTTSATASRNSRILVVLHLVDTHLQAFRTLLPSSRRIVWDVHRDRFLVHRFLNSILAG